MKRKYAVTCLLVCVIIISIMIIQSCKNRKAQPKTNTPVSAEFQFKERLSDYGFFKGPLHELSPEVTLINYELVTPLFTDYAVKDRFILLPTGKTIQYASGAVFDFPDSTIIIKNFAYRDTLNRKIMIETRLLVKNPYDKKWKVMNYLWNTGQTDAVKHITGAKVPITLLDDDDNKISTIYQVPNTNDCKRCHVKNDVLAPIGLKARNLNFIRAGQTVNQLEQWVSQRHLSGLPSSGQIPILPDWKDRKHFTVVQRARAYIDINCAHCHSPGGDAYNTGLFLEYEQTDPDKIGIMKAPVSAGAGAGGLDYDIVPGDAAHSVLAYRMNSAEPGTAMPELARTVIHKEGVQLITEWINHLPTIKK